MHNDAFYLKKLCRNEKGKNKGINRVLDLFLLKLKINEIYSQY